MKHFFSLYVAVLLLLALDGAAGDIWKRLERGVSKTFKGFTGQKAFSGAGENAMAIFSESMKNFKVDVNVNNLAPVAKALEEFADALKAVKAGVDEETLEEISAFRLMMYDMGREIKHHDFQGDLDALEEKLDDIFDRADSWIEKMMDRTHHISKDFGTHAGTTASKNWNQTARYVTDAAVSVCYLVVVLICATQPSVAKAGVVALTGLVAFAHYTSSPSLVADTDFQATTETENDDAAGGLCDALDQVQKAVNDISVDVARVSKFQQEMTSEDGSPAGARLSKLEKEMSSVWEQSSQYSGDTRRIAFKNGSPEEQSHFTLQKGLFLVKMRGFNNDVPFFGQLVLERLVTFGTGFEWKIVGDSLIGREGPHKEDHFHGNAHAGPPYTVTDFALVECAEDTTFRMKLMRRNGDAAVLSDMEAQIFSLPTRLAVPSTTKDHGK